MGCLAMCKAFIVAGSSFAGEDRGRLRESALSGSSENSSGFPCKYHTALVSYNPRLDDPVLRN